MRSSKTSSYQLMRNKNRIWLSLYNDIDLLNKNKSLSEDLNTLHECNSLGFIICTLNNSSIQRTTISKQAASVFSDRAGYTETVLMSNIFKMI